jgi:hypothetical protein
MFRTGFRVACSITTELRSNNQAFRRSTDGAVSTVGSSMSDGLSAALTEMVRLRRFNGGYPGLALGLRTSPLG